MGSKEMVEAEGISFIGSVEGRGRGKWIGECKGLWISKTRSSVEVEGII